MTKKQLVKNIKKRKYIYIMLIFVLAWYLVFTYIPMVGILMAFEDFHFSKGFLGSPFVGLANFQKLFADFFFVDAFRNTFIIALLRIIFVFPQAILLALLLNELRSIRFKRIMTTITSIPHFFSWVALSSIMMMVLSEDRGIVNLFLSAIGQEQIGFLYDNTWFRWTLIFTDIMKETGWNSIIFTAAIVSINNSLYEAAIVDGANRWQLVRNITIPSIAPIISIMFILYIGSVFGQGFDQVFNLYNPLVYETGDILDTYIFRTLKDNFNFGLSSAAGFIKSTICLVFLYLSNWVVRITGNESIY